MSDRYDLLETTLKTKRFSVTKPRKLVFDVLENEEPQSMQQIVAKLQNIMNRASVYRTIALFEELGIIQRLQFGWKYKLELSDAFHHHHHHFLCTNCNAILPLHEDDQLETYIETLAKKAGLQPYAHQLEITGLCKKCQKI